MLAVEPRPNRLIPVAQLKRERSLLANLGLAEGSLPRYLKYMARTWLVHAFLSSSPTIQPRNRSRNASDGPAFRPCPRVLPVISARSESIRELLASVERQRRVPVAAFIQKNSPDAKAGASGALVSRV